MMFERKSLQKAGGRRRGLLIANLLAQLAFGLVAMTICLPSMQEWPAMFGAGQSDVQLTFSAYVVAYGGLQLVYGPLSDRLGRKPVLLVGLAIALAGSVLAAAAPDLKVLIAARALQGAGTAACMVLGRALINDLFEGPDRTRMMAFVGMTMGLCPPLATLLGGHIHVRFGWRTNFVVMAVLALLLLLAAWHGVPQAAKTGGARDHWLRAMGSAYARLAREPAFLLYVAILAMSTATLYTFLAGAPIVLAGYGVGPEHVGWYIMMIPLPYMLGNFLTSRLIRARGELFIMRLGQVGTIGGLLLMLALAAAGIHTPLAFAMPLMLLGVGHGLLIPPALAGTVSLVPVLAGSAAAVAGLLQQLTGALGGYAVGLVPHHGPVNLGLMMLMMSLVALAAQFLLHGRYAGTRGPHLKT